MAGDTDDRRVGVAWGRDDNITHVSENDNTLDNNIFYPN